MKKKEKRFFDKDKDDIYAGMLGLALWNYMFQNPKVKEEMEKIMKERFEKMKERFEKMRERLVKEKEEKKKK